SVQGRSRQQIFILNLDPNQGNVSDWNSSEFAQHCTGDHPFYIKGAAWSPDQATVYIATTGEFPLNWGASFPLTGLCDVDAACPASQAGALHPRQPACRSADSPYSPAA